MTNESIVMPLILTFIAGIATVLGAVVIFLFKNFNKEKLLFSLSISAGAMLYISFVELMGHAVREIGHVYADLGFLFGLLTMFLLDLLIPHNYIAEKSKVNASNSNIYKSGVLISLGIAIHNFPEGLAVFLSGLGSFQLATGLALAIALHNIPEGIAIAGPIYYATKSRGKALWYTLLAGLAEPVGALIGYYFLKNVLTNFVINYLFAWVAGVMVFISFDELLPQVYKNSNHNVVLAGIIAGIILMMLSLVVSG